VIRKNKNLKCLALRCLIDAESVCNKEENDILLLVFQDVYFDYSIKYGLKRIGKGRLRED
jgi:hypothetical protein